MLITCSNCCHEIEVSFDVDAIGEKVQCPHCGKEFIVRSISFSDYSPYQPSVSIGKLVDWKREEDGEVKP